MYSCMASATFLLYATASTTVRAPLTASPEAKMPGRLVRPKAGGVGLNLTGAGYVFILDPWWNVAAEEQAISRAYRIGQKRSVFVYRFITEGTLEEKILNMQKDKQNLVDAVIRTGIV